MFYGPLAFADIGPQFQIAGLALGVFDGVHLGHRAVIESLNREKVAVITFEPHPLFVIAPERAPHRLTSLQQKNALMQALEVKAVFALHFNSALREMSATTFVDEINRVFPCLRYLAVGKNFSFGLNREGTPEKLVALAHNYRIKVKIAEPVLRDGLPVSSTRIREAIWQRRLAEAESLLGWSYAISGTVVEGEKRGRLLGFPTANLDYIEQLIPPPGVYAVQVYVASRSRNYQAVVNFGFRPTFGQYSKPTAEVHLLDFSGDLYGQTLVLHGFVWLRDEQKFGEVAGLKRQIEADITKARIELASS